MFVGNKIFTGLWGNDFVGNLLNLYYSWVLK
jgi:hypothetical protein